MGEMTEIQLFNVGCVLDIRPQTGSGAVAAPLRSPDATCDVWRVKSSASLRTWFPLRAPE